MDRIWGLPASSVSIAAAVALGIVALGVLLAGVLGRRAGGLAPIGHPAGDRRPRRQRRLQRRRRLGRRPRLDPTAVTGTTEYTLGAGNATARPLPRLPAGATPSDPAEIDARVGAGHLTVAVPAGLGRPDPGEHGRRPVEVDDVAGLAADPRRPTDQAAHDGGHDVDVDVRSGTAPVLLVRADVGLGNLSLVSANG